jgi:hypothetical protein
MPNANLCLVFGALTATVLACGNRPDVKSNSADDSNADGGEALADAGGTDTDGDTEAATSLAVPRPTGTDATTLVASAPFLDALLADGSSVYWADNTGAVWSVPLGGGTPLQLASTGVSDQFPSIALDANNVYIANGTAISSVPIGGGALTNLTTASGNTAALAIQAGSLYWVTESSPETINEMSAQGGSVATIASNLEAPSYIVNDANNVYWADIGTGDINSIPNGGGNVTVLVSNQGGINGLAIKGDYLYWSNFSGIVGAPAGQNPPPAKLGDGTVNRISVNGGDTKVVVKAYTMSGITVDGDYVYWSDGQKNTISRTTLDGSSTKVLTHDTATVGPVVQSGTLYYGVLLQTTFAIRSVGL